MLYNKFSAGVCKDLLDGLDLMWASLACIFVISIAIIVLNLVLARYNCNMIRMINVKFLFIFLHFAVVL